MTVQDPSAPPVPFNRRLSGGRRLFPECSARRHGDRTSTAMPAGRTTDLHG
ncbi:hypothetical protein HMPREF9440_01924 [Sutterella parvirubra YIT 11816]|uniref:Uncharacterized protein n=1 Tax=Sutterella parvirubra YIT 11816 TaxID=762967 RepID=H3KGP2_9BURK|nr:hypothetical protein HMPREF9440_01924 [Sutterella parvirubra YIT 11816]